MASFTSPVTFVAGLVTSVMLNRLNTMIAELQAVANSSAPANIVLSGGATAGSVTPAARKISGTRVGLEGVVSSVSVGSSVNIGTIPAGYRPASQERQYVWGLGPRVILVDISTAGVITASYVAGTAGASVSIVLDGVTYEAA